MDQKPRPVSYHLQKPPKDWLDRGLKEEIFEKVQDGEVITWCSPPVVQPKPKFTEMKTKELECHMIRASWWVQSPRVEDSICRLHLCKILTKLDPRQGYHQLALDSSTTSCNTHNILGKLQTPTTSVWSEIVSRCL